MEFTWLSWLIIAALLANFLITAWADRLNLQALTPELPKEFAQVYSATEYSRSQQYTRAKTRFGLVTGGVDLVLLLSFWRLNGFNWLDQLIRGLGQGEVVTGLLYLGGLLLVKTVLAIPFSLWSTFVLEERYGFNRTTVRTFVLDLLKGIGLTVLLGGPLLALLLFFFQWAGPLAWLYGWGLTTAFIVILQFVAPTWIMPLFNTFTPLAEGELKERIMAYAKAVGFTLEMLFVIDGSKRSSKSNAFFAGFGKHKRIALYDTLIEGHSIEELIRNGISCRGWPSALSTWGSCSISSPWPWAARGSLPPLAWNSHRCTQG
jgi:STE24 endopeptidase